MVDASPPTDHFTLYAMFLLIYCTCLSTSLVTAISLFRTECLLVVYKQWWLDCHHMRFVVVWVSRAALLQLFVQETQKLHCSFFRLCYLHNYSKYFCFGILT